MDGLIYYIDLAKPRSGARNFFSRTSQGHNALQLVALDYDSHSNFIVSLRSSMLIHTAPLGPSYTLTLRSLHQRETETLFPNPGGFQTPAHSVGQR